MIIQLTNQISLEPHILRANPMHLPSLGQQIAHLKVLVEIFSSVHMAFKSKVLPILL
jgi:hypothetical protein